MVIWTLTGLYFLDVGQRLKGQKMVGPLPENKMIKIIPDFPAKLSNVCAAVNCMMSANYLCANMDCKYGYCGTYLLKI